MTEWKGDQKLLLWSLRATERHINTFFKLYAVQPYFLHSGAAEDVQLSLLLSKSLSLAITKISGSNPTKHLKHIIIHFLWFMSTLESPEKQTNKCFSPLKWELACKQQLWLPLTRGDSVLHTLLSFLLDPAWACDAPDLWHFQKYGSIAWDSSDHEQGKKVKLVVRM